MTKQSEHFRTLLEQHPDKRVKTLHRMRSLLASHCLGRNFDETMEDYYTRRPTLKETDEEIEILIYKYEVVA